MADKIARGDRDRLVIQLQQTINDLMKLQVDQPCTGCELYGGDGYCTRWKVFVPERNVPDGCNNWQEKIPF